MENKKVQFNITGFGKFGNIQTNPTEILLNYIKQDKEQLNNRFDLDIDLCDILEVSIQGVQHYYSQQFTNILAKQHQNPQTQQIIIHLGVNATKSCFNLEQFGYNYMDFRIPDERGNQPRNEVIDPQLHQQKIQSGLKLENIAEQLQGKDVQISDDPGRYICNYAYFKCLENCINNTVKGLFVHVPNFKSIEFVDQLDFIIQLMNSIKQTETIGC